MTAPVLRRTRLLIAAGAAATGLVAGLTHDARFGLGVALAGAWAWCSLRALEGLLGAVVVPPGRKRSTWRAVLWAAAKLGIYVLAVWALIVRPLPVLSLLLGVTWLPLALVVAGLLPASRTGPDSTTRGGACRE